MEESGWREPQRKGGGIRLNKRKHNARAGEKGVSGRTEEHSAPYSVRVL